MLTLFVVSWIVVGAFRGNLSCLFWHGEGEIVEWMRFILWPVTTLRHPANMVGGYHDDQRWRRSMIHPPLVTRVGHGWINALAGAVLGFVPLAWTLFVLAALGIMFLWAAMTDAVRSRVWHMRPISIEPVASPSPSQPKTTRIRRVTDPALTSLAPPPGFPN